VRNRSLSAWLLFATALSASAEMLPVDLRCEYLRNPLGLDVPQPRLSWQFESGERDKTQLAYQVHVASSAEALNAGKGDVWDSGRVNGSASVQVPYAGPPLQPRTRYWWTVRVWDEKGHVSGWSRPGSWSMGPFAPAGWRGEWIGAQPVPRSATESPAVLLRKTVSLHGRPKQAFAYVSGLGYYELYINGAKVGDHVLDPGFTNFDKTVLYVTYDVTGLLRAGENGIGAMLGNGWYNSPTPDLFGFERAPWRAEPKLLLNVDIEYEDGTRQQVDTDTSWKGSPGALVFNCIRGGETWDARLEQEGWSRAAFDATSWKDARILKAPAGRLVAQKMPPMRVTESVRPVRVTEPLPGTWVFDFGVNLTGWAHLEASGTPGQLIRMEYNEVLRPDGTVNMQHSHGHTHGRFNTDELILDAHGKGVFEGHFTYHGFRYVQVTGLGGRPSADSIVARGVHTDWQQAGDFTTSDTRMSTLQSAVVRTLNNTAHSMPGEEATREKMGWTQDGQNVMESAIYNFDAAPVYWKYLNDMIDAQESNGHVPPIVPTNGWGLTTDGKPHRYSDPWWGGTLPFVAWKLYEYYGDERALESAYEPMKRWVAYMRGTAADNLVDWKLGDWQEAGKNGTSKRTPVILASTAGYYYAVIKVRDAARVLGRQADQVTYAQLAESIRESYNRHFFQASTATWAADSQTASALSLWLGLAPDDQRGPALRALIENIHAWNDHTSAGFVGIMPEVDGLPDWGYADLAWKLVSQETSPNWWHMVSDGNTTMTEALDEKLQGSRTHPFGACIGEWFYRILAGIRPDLRNPGFAHVVIQPAFVDGLEAVKASYQSLHGRIEVSWTRQGDAVALEVGIPANVTATIRIPDREVKVGSGVHRFEVHGR
jgi:alpha-L-rhamnosidase